MTKHQQYTVFDTHSATPQETAEKAPRLVVVQIAENS